MWTKGLVVGSLRATLITRIVALATLAIETNSIDLDLPLDIMFVEPDEPLPEVCRAGVQLFGR
ncbi:MAG: hypothetical protein ABT18_13335 [Rhodanobacter sp. SCN 66-43]|nr:MAG: hypothetical protein ABT18_13335 [Rhodanobacter sp. SCN 66-43]